jgi:hypothetical protein
LTETALHNAVNEPAMYLDEKHVTHQCRAEGHRVAKEMRVRQAVSEDYEDGFVDGYADALERGGEPLPPAVPPTKYRRGRFLNADGHARIHNYFAGFQHGATCAASSGKRQFLTVPIMLPDQPVEQQPAVQQVPKEQCGPTAGANCPPGPAPKVTSLPASPERHAGRDRTGGAQTPADFHPAGAAPAARPGRPTAAVARRESRPAAGGPDPRSSGGAAHPRAATGGAADAAQLASGK